MKRIKVTAVIVITITILLGFYIREISLETTNSNNVKSKVEEDILAFSVLGDIHGNVGKLRSSINDLYSINNNMDAMVLNGDNVDEGLQNQYDAVKSTLSKNSKLLPKTIIKNIGNHDYFNYARGKNAPSDVESFIRMYSDFSGEKSVYHDTWIKGYHFISLGSESGNTKELGAVNAYLSEKQLDWLKERLAEKHEKGKPIFVFLHQHLATSIKGWNGVVQRKELKEILSSYPEVILFTSHTHVLLEVDNVKLNQPFTTVHTGAVSYGIMPEGYTIKRLYGESQGLYVEVKGNKTVIKGRDFSKKSWVFTKEIDLSPK
ncbi:metallophosphoesterase [Clostridium sp. CX1]|uniref:metallophosphoesterase family protein n=1 Tax=Clostridium sp. CX1 TaxID=2978346 RepID=UPI0021BF8D22|nr:metallophosphoesterase [Clostridium sp. CX1]MCT8978788.1 metallophosphoesterase [Clostridium sp. CX1]